MEFQKITLQGIFNAAWQHFIIDGAEPGVSLGGGGCSYLNENGHKCAIGLVLPEGHEVQKCGRFVSAVMGSYPELFETPEELTAIVHAQQALHDQLCGGVFDERTEKYVPEWTVNSDIKRLVYLGFAREYNLTVPGEN